MGAHDYVALARAQGLLLEVAHGRVVRITIAIRSSPLLCMSHLCLFRVLMPLGPHIEVLIPVSRDTVDHA